MENKWCLLLVIICLSVSTLLLFSDRTLFIVSCWSLFLIPTPILRISGPFILMVLYTGPVVFLITMVYLYVKYIPLKRKGEVNGFRDMFPSSRTLWLLLFYLIAGLFFLGGLASLFNKEYKRACVEFLVILLAMNMIFTLQNSPISISTILRVWFDYLRENIVILVAYYYTANIIIKCSEAIVNEDDSPPRGLFRFFDRFEKMW